MCIIICLLTIPKKHLNVQIKNSSYNRLLLFLAFLVPGILLGQSTDTYPKQMGFGLKAGATYSSLVLGIPLQQMNAGIDPSFGLIFNYIDKKTVGIQIELNYVSKSWEENPSGDYLFTSKLDYIEVPMLTTLHFGNKLKLLVNFGPYLSILLNEESYHNVDESSSYFEYYKNRSPRKGDFGMIGGAGLRLQTKLGLFQLEGRYSYGFQNLYDTDENNLDYSNMTTIGVFLSYQFLFSNEH